MKYLHYTLLTLLALPIQLVSASTQSSTSPCEVAINTGELPSKVEAAVPQFEELFDFYRALPDSVRGNNPTDEDIQLIADTYSQVSIDLAARFDILKSYQSFTNNELRQLYFALTEKLKNSAGQVALRKALLSAYYRTLSLDDIALEPSFGRGIVFPERSLDFDALNRMILVQTKYLAAKKKKEREQLWHQLVAAYRDGVGRDTYGRYSVQTFQSLITTAIKIQSTPRAGLVVGTLANGGREVLNSLEEKLPHTRPNSLEYRGLQSILAILEIAGNSFDQHVSFADPNPHLLDPKLKLTIDSALNGTDTEKQQAFLGLANTVSFYQRYAGTSQHVSISMAHLLTNGR